MVPAGVSYFFSQVSSSQSHNDTAKLCRIDIVVTCCSIWLAFLQMACICRTSTLPPETVAFRRLRRSALEIQGILSRRPCWCQKSPGFSACFLTIRRYYTHHHPNSMAEELRIPLPCQWWVNQVRVHCRQQKGKSCDVIGRFFRVRLIQNMHTNIWWFDVESWPMRSSFEHLDNRFVTKLEYADVCRLTESIPRFSTREPFIKQDFLFHTISI